MTFTFQVHQNRAYLKSQGVGHASAMVGEFPATMHGLRKAKACVVEHTYGQEPGRIAPKARCVIVAASNGEPVKLRGHEAYDDQDNWLDYFLIEDIDTEPDAGPKQWGVRETKTSLFAQMLKKIEAHASKENA